jgi:hypothetical protein
MSELTAEQKLANLKLKLSEDIRSNDRQIRYEIKKVANHITKLIRDKLANGAPEKIELYKEEYSDILEFLFCIKEDVIYKRKGSEYTTSYYDDNRIKTEILNQL